MKRPARAKTKRPVRATAATQRDGGRALREREYIYRQIFDATSDALFIHDDTGRIVLVNEQTCAMYGCSAEEARTLTIADLSSNEPPFTQADAVAKVAQAAREGSCTFPWRSRRRNGELFWSEVALRRFDLGGRMHLIASVRDIDTRKTIEEALRESEERFATIFNAASTMLAFTEPEQGRIIDVNRAWLQTTGLRREDVVGKTGRELGLWHRPQDRDAIVGRLAAAGRVREFEAELDMGGRTIPAQISVEHIEMRGGRYILWEVRDLSDRKIAEAEQERLRAELMQSQKMESVGQLAGGIAHDFNNILSVILSYTSLIASSLRQNDPVLHDLDEIRRAGERASSLTRKLLAFSRKQVLQPRVLDPGAVLHGMEPMLRRIIGEHIELVVRVQPSVGRIKADVAHLEQALMNLVVNSRDAMPRGGTLTIEASDTTVDDDYATSHLEIRPGPHVLIAVSDTGIGMDEATRARAFEPFFTTKQPGQGTGLGLSTVFGIVKQSGGAIWLYSEPAHGTTFKLYFPRTGEDLVVTPAGAGGAHARAGRTILLVEDEPPLRVLVRRILLREGFTVLEAPGPVEALEVAREHPGDIHLLLTDVIMPQMNGPQLAERLTSARPSTRVLFMSGYTENTLASHGVVNEGVNFLPKPFTPDQVLAMVSRVLESA